MRSAVVIVLASVVGAAVLPAQGRTERPSLEDVFADLTSMLDRVDPAATAALRARHEQNQRELSLLEKLRSAHRRGVPITVPVTLRGAPVTAASEALLAEERRRKAALEARVAALERRRDRPVEAPPVSDGRTPLASALLTTEVLPAATANDEVAVGSPGNGAEKDAVASERLREALASLEVIAPERRSVADTYRMARLLHRLERSGEARPLYRQVMRDDDGGFFGNQARWMLSLLEQRGEIRDILGRMSRPSGAKK